MRDLNHRRCSSLSGPVFLFTGLVALTIAASARANVVINVWTGPTSFHHKRIGVPDQDQKRVSLPNSGSCYCVPTSMMNLLMYVSNHGYPQVVPGPGSYSGYDTYYPVTFLLEDLGGWASISAGGPDPDDPDCNGDKEKDGVCSTLPCGGSTSAVYEALIDHGWLGNAEDDLVWTSRYHDQNAPPASFQTFGELAADGNVLVVCFGRYKPVAGSGTSTIYRRSGGHCVTMNEIRRNGSVKELSIRDPANDDDIFGPSTYATTKWNITDITFLVTDTPTGDILLNWWSASFSAINEPQSDGVHRCLDGYMAVAPKAGVFWKDYSFIKKLPLSGGFGPDPLPHPTPNAPIMDLVPDHNNLGSFALLAGTEVAPPRLVHINPASGQVSTLADLSASRLALGDRSELFTIATGNPVLKKFNLTGSELQSVGIPGIPAAIAYHDATDRVYVFVPSTAGPGGTVRCYERDLSLPPTIYQIPVTTTVGSMARMSFNPKNGELWIASLSQDRVFGFAFPSAGSALIPTQTLAGFAQLTSVEFDDVGRMYTADAGAARVFEQSQAGDWMEVSAGALAGQDVGEVLRISRSRSNYNAAVQETAMWENLPGDEVETLGEVSDDCIGDLNGDGVINGAEISIVLGAWSTGNSYADINGDGVVDGADLAMILGSWGPC